MENDGNYSYDAKKINDGAVIAFANENIRVLTSMLLKKYQGQQITALALYEEHQQETLFTWTHYTETLRDMVGKGKVKATFTDNVNHKVSVIITDTCILNF